MAVTAEKTLKELFKLTIRDEKTKQPFLVSKINPENIQALRETKSFSCDLETTSLDPLTGEIRLVQVYLPKIQTVVYCDLWEENDLKDLFVSVLKKKLSDWTVIKIWHNALFDLSWILYHWGVNAVNNFDSMIGSQMDKAGMYFGYQKAFRDTPNSLKFLIFEHGLEHSKEIDHEIWKKPGTLPEFAIFYGCRDAYYTFIIGKYYKEKLSFCSEAIKAEMGSLSVFAYMNTIGLPTHLETLEERLKEYSTTAEKIRLDLESKIVLDPYAALTWYNTYYQERGLPKKLNTPEALSKEAKKTKFNPTSFQSVGKWLCSIVPVERLIRKNNKTGAIGISTDKSTLFQLTTEIDDPDIQEKMKTLIYFRSINGAASKFKSYRESFRPELQSLAVSYTVLARQGTGRSSSGKKREAKTAIKFHNGQNFSKKLPSHYKYNLGSTRSIVQAREGYVLAEFDAAASHLQIARHLSQDPSLIEANRTGIKVHYYTLSGILKQAYGVNVPPSEVRELVEAIRPCVGYPFDLATLKHLYKLGKNVIYSFVNYAGGATLQQQFFKQEVFVSLPDCKAYLEACAKQYKTLRKFQDRNFERAKRTLRAYRLNGKYLGHFATVSHLDGAITYHQAKFAEGKIPTFLEKYDDDDDEEYDATEEYIQTFAVRNSDLYLKISDVTAVCWLRPEATMMKNALANIFKYQIESRLDFRVINYSHDSFLLEIQEDIIDTVAPVAYDSLNGEYQRWIPDYIPEGTYKDCVLGRYWEKP